MLHSNTHLLVNLALRGDLGLCFRSVVMVEVKQILYRLSGILILPLPFFAAQAASQPLILRLNASRFCA